MSSDTLYRAHQQILRMLIQRGFYVPPDIQNRTPEEELATGQPQQDIYSNFYFRLTDKNLIEYAYITFKLIHGEKTQVSNTDVKAFTIMATSPLVSSTGMSVFRDGYSLPITLGYSPPQLQKTFNSDYLEVHHQYPVLAPRPRQALLISNDLSHSAKTEFRNFVVGNTLKNGSIDIVQHFRFDELLFDVMEHSSQAKFYPLSEKEKEELMIELGVKEGQLPIMLETDPIAKYYALKKGTLVRILQSLENIPSISSVEVEYRIIS